MLKHFILSYLRFWAKTALQKHNPTIIGIAGSVGKSSTRNALEAILKDHFPTKSVGNSETGIPLGILGLIPTDYSPRDWLTLCLKAPFGLNFIKGTKYLITEMGIDEPDPPKNMEYLLTIIKPDIAIVLNESATHSMQFDKTVTEENLTPEIRLEKVIDNIAKEDIKIITRSKCKVGIYNADDKYIEASLKDFEKKHKLRSFGSDNEFDICFGDYTANLEGSTFTLHAKEEKGNVKIILHFENVIIPKEYQEVLAASILAARTILLTHDQIRESLIKNFTLPKGRSGLLKGINNTIILDSSYNASKASTLAFLDLIYRLKRLTKRPITILLGDMRELGNESKTEHEEVAEKIKDIADYLYLVGPLTREYVLPVVQKDEDKFKEIRWFDTSTRAGEFLKDNIQKDAIILVKGSQNTIFLEEAIKSILEDKKDITKLCRQSNFWMKQKKPQTLN